MATFDENPLLYAKLVTPFYGECTSYSIVRESIEKQTLFAARFREVMPEYSDDVLIEMLHDSNWRPGKAAAWVIAARRDACFIPLIRSTMLDRPSHVEHLCVALAAIGTDESAKVLEAYLDVVLANRDPLEEQIDPDPAISAIEVIDRNKQTQRAIRFVAIEGLWNTFVLARPEILAEGWRRRLAWAREHLPRAVEFVRTRLR